MRFSLLLLLPLSLWARYEEPWGKDAPLLHLQQQQEESNSFLVKAAQKVILFHQNVISPVDGPRSHFRPTSCRYMYHAMRRYGFWKGFIMGCNRLMRENDDPWVYRTKKIGDVIYKWDPPLAEEHRDFSLAWRVVRPLSLNMIGDPEN